MSAGQQECPLQHVPSLKSAVLGNRPDTCPPHRARATMGAFPWLDCIRFQFAVAFQKPGASAFGTRKGDRPAPWLLWNMSSHILPKCCVGLSTAVAQLTCPAGWLQLLFHREWSPANCPPCGSWPQPQDKAMPRGCARNHHVHGWPPLSHAVCPRWADFLERARQLAFQDLLALLPVTYCALLF